VKYKQKPQAVRPGWIDVDINGLEKILARRGKVFIAHELIQNAWDEQTTRVDVRLSRPEQGKSRIVVTDDSLNGFRDLSHSFTMYAESDKKRQSHQRGMFNVGEKFVLAFCEEATIVSTSGAIIFDRNGRRRSRKRTLRGSEFSGLIRLTYEEWKQISRAVQRLIPPVPTYFNGTEIRRKIPIHSFECALPTLEADADGNLHRTTKKTVVRVYEPSGEEACLYEMGIPVVGTGDKWHVDIQQKVLLNLERDNVIPSYLQTVRVAVLNAMTDRLSPEDASSPWVRIAAGDPRVEGPVFSNLIHLRFGDKRVTFDPSDREANLIAASKGYVVIPPASLSKDEWSNVRRFGTSLPAGQITPSPTPFSLTGEPLRMLSAGDKMPALVCFESFAKALALKLIARPVTIEFAEDPGWVFEGCYGKGRLIVNVASRGASWFEGTTADLLERWIPFLIHEFAHDKVPGHLTEGYYVECCRLAGILARCLYEDPGLLDLLGAPTEP
jgi:Histidine kinase-, DNA gyrase B-, and HSP90-like ATPase